MLFERLHEAGYLRRGRIVDSKVRNSSLCEMLDFAQQSVELTSAKDLPRDSAVFSQAASLSLGCSPWPCSTFECRLERAEQLAHYAALYGDRIYVRNFLADYIKHLERKRPPNEEAVRSRFVQDVRLLTYLRPVIEAGRVVLVTPPNYCLSCLSKHSLGLKDDKPLRKAMRDLTAEIEGHINVVVQRIGNDAYGAIAKGPEDLLSHGSACFVSESPPPKLQTMPRIFRRVQKGEEVSLSRWALRRIGYADCIAGMHHRSIFFELALAQCLGTGFLTDMPVHIRFLKSLSLNPPGAERDLAIERHLTCLVPFAKELTPSEILKLRNQDEEAFVLFKAALANAVSEYKQNYGDLTELDAKALYSDIIRPKLSRLESRVQKSRRSFVKGTSRKVLAWTAAISVGLYSGFLPQGLLAAAAALGLTKILAEFTEDLMNNSDTEDSIRDQDMYFLWKLLRRTGKSRVG